MNMSLLRRLLGMLILLLTGSAALAIDAQYAKKLERAGCTQLSELHGCDINKSWQENAKSGFVSGPRTGTEHLSGNSPYAGRWQAKSRNGTAVALIRIDTRNRVWVNEKAVKAKLGDVGLFFKDGFVTYVIEGDRRLNAEGYWINSDTNTEGVVERSRPDIPRLKR